MHAFDLATLAGSRDHASGGRGLAKRITTLDGVERTLDPDMLVIADRDRAQAVAGVMGGADSEVSATTTTVAFESAYFKPASVRRTSKRLGLKTEASSRFERGADISVQVVALQRAIALMEQIGAGRVVGSIVDRAIRGRATPSAPAPASRSGWPRLLGATVPDAEVERILRGLGLDVSRVRRRMGRRRADLPRRPRSRSRSDRRGRPSPWAGQVAADVPGASTSRRRRPTRASDAINWCGGP